MRSRWIITVLFALSGCSLPAISQQIPVATPDPTPPPTEETVSAALQRLTLRLTLSSPDDLKVRAGDRVQANQVLSDRLRERQRLEAQKRQLQIQIDRLQAPIAGPPAARSIPEVAGLPPASFLDEVAEVERQRVKVQQAEAVVVNQQRMVDLLSSMPEGELPQATIPHEQEVLKQKQQELDQVRAEMQLAEAKLVQAQQDRQYQEYLYSLEMSKRSIAIQQGELQRQEQLQRQEEQERDRSFKLAQLQVQMQQLDTQLFALSSVRSPYSGTIQRIAWKGQTDQNLVVELTLMADADRAPADQSTGE